MQYEPARTQLIRSYADSVKVVWIVMCALAGVALLLRILTKALSWTVPWRQSRSFSQRREVKEIWESS